MWAMLMSGGILKQTSRHLNIELTCFEKFASFLRWESKFQLEQHFLS